MNRYTTVWFTAALLLFARSSLAQNEVYKDPTAAVEARVEDLLPRMTLREKIGQMIMDIENTFEFAPDIGGYMFGAGGLDEAPNSPERWRARQNELQAASSNTRLGIPLILGADTVHGQNIISGGTVFPHNIGLGCTRNSSLLREIARVTAEECITSGLDLAFAPTLAVARQITWGRTYESYSEDTNLVRSLTSDFIEGLQENGVEATAKHWVADGGTVNGEDAGDVVLTEQQIMDIHGAPYIDAIASDVGSIMISFSSINGTQMHGNEYWVTDVLKGAMGFEGFALSDWEAYTRNPGDYDNQLRVAINSGLDMLLAPYQSYQIFDSVTNSVQLGLISESRIDDAVRRILRVKFKSGLFERKVDPIDPNTYQPLGSTEHRAVARQAVRESLVLLKNDINLLPLSKGTRIFLAGKSADNIQNQCGGWTMSWQGTSNEERHRIIGGTTIRSGMENVVTETITFNETGLGADPDQHDVAIAVIGETPYAEFEGDREDLSLDAIDQATIANVQASGLPIILIVISGRPMVMMEEIKGADVVVAAWLPGTEGDGLAEVLFGDYDFQGKLSFSWPANMAQITNGFVGDNPDVLYEFGFGLNYGNNTEVATAAPSTAVESAPPSPMPSEGLASTNSPIGSSTSLPTLSPTVPDEPTISPTSSAPILPGQSLDIGAPSQPGPLVLEELTSTSISFSWAASTDNIAVTEYKVFDGSRPVKEGTDETSFTMDGLTPGTSHSYTVIAFDAAGNESPPSGSLTVATPFQVDDFDDGDEEAMNGFGEWRSASDGTESDGMCTFTTQVAGYSGFGARVVYVIDSGDWGYCNIFLDFDSGNDVDLTESDIAGVQFKMRGSPNTSFHLQLGTSLADFNWKYYSYRLTPVDRWTTVTVWFDEMKGDEDIPYSLSQALQSATSLVWENSNVGQGGWLLIDDVDFLTPASKPILAEQKQQEETSSSLPATGPSILIILMSIGIIILRL
jgi:beta-glucosidase